jgi:tripartite-type tricarboxylate transporter receptor subunit TctC
MLGATPLVPARTAAAQPAGFPDRPMRMIVPFAPGGVADIVARIVAQKMG